MNNPYQTSWMRGLKHRSVALHAIMRVLLLPKYSLWLLGERLPRLQLRLEEALYVLMTPLRAVTGFITAWAEGRNWKKLLVASPIIVIAFVGFTVLYINVNKNRGRAFAGYYQGAMQAMQDGDYKKSDGLFAKLIHHSSYKDNNQVLYRAMVSAAQNGNTPRVKALQKKLVEEREYEPAVRWVIDSFVAQPTMKKTEAIEYAELAEKMLAESVDAESASYWRMVMARIRVGLKNYEGAVAILREDKSMLPHGYLLLAQVLVVSGDEVEYLKVLHEMLDFIELEDPTETKFFTEKVEGWALIAANAQTSEEALELLPRAMELVERKRALATATRKTYSVWLSELNIRMFQFALQSRDVENRRKGFSYFDAALQNGEVPARTGSTILSVVNSSASYSLLSGQILDVAVNDGGCGAHLALGMEAWLQNDLDVAELHFNVAYAVQPSSLDVLRAAARDLAKRSVEAQLDMAVFKGVNRSNYQRSQDLLRLVKQIDPSLTVDIQFDQCYVYSLRENWSAIVKLLEPSVDSLTGQNLLAAYNWLYGASMGLDKADQADEFKRLMLTEARNQRNSR